MPCFSAGAQNCIFKWIEIEQNDRLTWNNMLKRIRIFQTRIKTYGNVLKLIKCIIFQLSTLFWRVGPPSQADQPGQAKIQLRDTRQIPPGFLKLKRPFVAQNGSWRPGALISLFMGGGWRGEYQNVLRSVQMNYNVFTHIKTYSNVSKRIKNVFKRIKTYWNVSKLMKTY